jgi:hypothetical protein
MISVGDFVELSPTCTKREWYPEVKHLKGIHFRITKVEGDYLTFLCKDGKGRGENRAYRRWHISNLMQVILSLENE